MKVLLTGSTANHVSQNKNSRSMTFTSQLHDALRAGKHEVSWVEPSVAMTSEYLSEFDSVIVGIAPPTSTSAHRIYGSLSIINHSWKIGNLRILIDAPDPRKIWAGLSSVDRNPDDLIKDFYSKRKEYKKLQDKEVFDRISESVSMLLNNNWPKTIYPCLPWMSSVSVMAYIPTTNKLNLAGFCFDRKIVEGSEKPVSESPEYWLSDYRNSPWSKQQERLVELPVVPEKISKWEKDSDTAIRMTKAIGCLVSIHRSGDPWWSPAIPLSLSNGTPVASDWLLTSMLGDSWRALPCNIEQMDRDERYDLLVSQIKTYSESLPTWKDSVDLLTKVIKD
jgi:hypothetical protein